jgi:GMP synthase-like glutamine amidotransferase
LDEGAPRRRVGILIAGDPPGELAERFGRYDAMFARLLGPGFETVPYEAARGELPARPDEQPAWLVTGSAAGVYDPLPWIEPLKGFLREAKGNAKLVGVCFGHQVMAEAFGGKVEKSERGWGVGLQRYEVVEHAPFMGGENGVCVPVSHQDQIVRQPPATRILAASGFSPFGVLAYEDQPALSMQFHPEFTPDYARALIEFRRERLPHPDAALASLEGADDRQRVAEWIRRFLA